MVIRNLDKKYMVLQECGNGETVRQYICSDVDGRDETLYRLAEQSVKSTTADEIRFLVEQIKNENFSDFVDYFVDDENLYIVTKKAREESLANKLAGEECTFRERSEIGKAVIERALLEDLPPYFLFASMKSDTISVKKTGEAFLEYDLENIMDFPFITEEDAFKAMGNVFSELFADEMELKSIPELDSFIYKLRHGEAADLRDIYKEFAEICRKYKNYTRNNAEPQNFMFRLWDKIKALGRRLREFIPALILIGALIYMILTVIDFFKPPKSLDKFSDIGEVSIVRHEETEDGR